MIKTKSAFALSLRQLARLNVSRAGHLYLWTFTLPSVVSTRQAKAMWNLFLTVLRKEFPKLSALTPPTEPNL